MIALSLLIARLQRSRVGLTWCGVEIIYVMHPRFRWKGGYPTLSLSSSELSSNGILRF
jgi:hypothetical protein